MVLIPEGYAQINWQFGGAQAPTGAETTLAVRLEDPAMTPGDAAIAASAAWLTNVHPDLSLQLVLVNTHVKFGPNNIGPAGDAASAANGGVVDAATSPAPCYLVNKLTALGGHIGKGRMYVPGLVESAVNQSGVINSGNVTAITGDFQDLRTALIAADLVPVLLHSPPWSLLIPSEITSFNCQAVAATQRRRQRR